MELSVKPMTCVSALPNDLEFVSDSQDVAAIHDSVAGSSEYDAFFVRVGDGEYTEVWGICGIIPYNSKLTSRIL